LSDTAFIHEIRPGTPTTRVQLVLDIGEVMSLGLMAGAAIDASVFAPGMVDAETVKNANEMVRWTARAAEALVALTPDGQE